MTLLALYNLQGACCRGVHQKKSAARARTARSLSYTTARDGCSCARSYDVRESAIAFFHTCTPRPLRPRSWSGQRNPLNELYKKTDANNYLHPTDTLPLQKEVQRTTRRKNNDDTPM